MKPLAGLARLEVLYLENNAISDVSALAAFKNLDRLDLRNNAIADFSPLEGLPDKTFVRMEGNPGFPSGGPKITGLFGYGRSSPGTRLDDRTDFLSRATRGEATELKVATNGAKEGKAVGKSKWRLHRLAASGGDNINNMTAALGWGTREEIYDHIVYGSVILDAQRNRRRTCLSAAMMPSKSGSMVNWFIRHSLRVGQAIIKISSSYFETGEKCVVGRAG